MKKIISIVIAFVFLCASYAAMAEDHPELEEANRRIDELMANSGLNNTVAPSIVQSNSYTGGSGVRFEIVNPESLYVYTDDELSKIVELIAGPDDGSHTGESAWNGAASDEHTVHKILVYGNDAVPSDDIVRFSGIHEGDDISSIDENKVSEQIMSCARRSGLESPIYYSLEFRFLEYQQPDTVIIHVKERKACGLIQRLGLTYVLDMDLNVLDIIENTNSATDSLIELTGLTVNDDIQGGLPLVLESEEQEALCWDLLFETKLIGLDGIVTQTDLSNPASIVLAVRSRDHGYEYTVKLGNWRDEWGAGLLHARLYSLILVMNELDQMVEAGDIEPGGTIDVSTPESPYYS